jgi:hypothetical protein
MIPSKSHLVFQASIVASEMTEFIPGPGPPPHKDPHPHHPVVQQQGDPDKPGDPHPVTCS